MPKHARLRIVLIAIALIVNVPATAKAQAARVPGSTPELAELNLEELADVEVVYAASRYNQLISEAPSSITIITAEEIRRSGYRTLADALRNVTGFYTTYDRNYEYVGVRGFSSLGDYNTRILVLVDGHRLNDNVYDTAPIGTDFILDLDLVDRIEIVRGPSSAVYGTSAFFGVVNVVTRGARSLHGLRVGGSFASFSGGDALISYGRPAGERAGFLLSASTHTTAGPTLYFPEFASPVTGGGLTRDTDDDEAQRVLGTLTRGRLSLQGAYVRREKGIPTASFGTVFDDRRNRTIDSHGYLDGRYERDYGRDWRLTGRAFYDLYAYDGTYVYEPAVDRQTPSLFADRARGQWAGGEVQVVRHFGTGHRVVAGSEYRFNGRQQQRASDESEVYLDSNHSSNVWAGYTVAELALSRSVRLNGGARYDYFSTFGATASPRAGVIVNPSRRTSLKVLYGKAFRAPNTYELYYSEGAYGAKPNPELRPETIDTHELVVEQQIHANVRATASVFKYDVARLIGLETDPADGMLLYMNRERSRARGVEVALKARWPGDAAASIGYSYQHARDTQRDVSANSPAHLANLQLVVPVRSMAYAAADVHYVGRRRLLGGDYTDAYMIANVTLTNRVWSDRWLMSVSAYNALNENYANPASMEHVQRVIPQDGRTWRLKLTYRF
ncbi:MAG: TonB-dependent receptor [Acidobacteria bacterium]|nr:TonB-dependent receptor [Acidobacteriota bacterium]